MLVLVWPELLFYEGKEDGDDDACLECFSEDHEEDGYSKDLYHDGGIVKYVKRRTKVS